MRRLLAIGLTLAVALALLVFSVPFARADTTVNPPGPIAVGSWPQGIGVNPNTQRVYVVNNQSDNVSVIDANDNTVSATIPVGNSPVRVGIDPTTNQIYVANSADDIVSEIDGSSNTVSPPIFVDGGANGIGVNATTGMVYVTGSTLGKVSVIAESSGTVIGTPIAVGTSPLAVVVDPATNRIYVANRGSNSISVIDGDPAHTGTYNTVVNTIAVDQPQDLALDPTTHLIYVADQNNSQVAVIDANPTSPTTYEEVIGSVPVTGSPEAIGINPTTHKVYVASNISQSPPLPPTGQVSVIDGNPTSSQYKQVIATIPFGSILTAVGVLAGSPGTIYVANALDNTVTVIEGSDQGDLPTATATATGTPTPTATVTPTATPVVYRVYLPDVAPLPPDVTPPPYPLHRR